MADGLKIPLERAVAEYSNGRLRYPPRGCSAVMSAGLYGRNYDYDVRHYDRILVADPTARASTPASASPIASPAASTA